MKQRTTNYFDKRKQFYIKHTVHNFSSYVMSNEEYTALSFGLRHHIPTKSKDVAIEVEFEQFYQGLLRNLTHIPDNELTSLKTKLRSTCEKYSKINVPYKYKKVIDNRFKNENIVILKQDKNEVNTNIPKQEMRDFPLLCTKNVHFSYTGDIYTHADGVAMSLPLGLMLAGIFMVELERTI